MGFSETDQDIYLKDNALGKTHNLKAHNYSFNSETGTFANPFEIIYQNQLSIENPQINANEIVVYIISSDLIITSGNYAMENITIYDNSGRLIYTKKNINRSSYTISNL